MTSITRFATGSQSTAKYGLSELNEQAHGPTSGADLLR